MIALVVDENPQLRYLLRGQLRLAAPRIRVIAEAADADEALQRFSETHPALVVLDHSTPDEDGLHLATKMLADAPAVRVVLFSAYIDADTITRAEALGVTACVPKPDFDRLRQVVTWLTTHPTPPRRDP